MASGDDPQSEHFRRITDELLLLRSEHNDGNLTTLDELALHQSHLAKIEYINRACPNLRILLLQDNSIERIENLTRLRSLEYLNLSMNSVERIENLETCEALERLDLTLNFIGALTEGLTEMAKGNPHLRELHLTGNPCSKFDGYRDFVIAMLPNLDHLDGTDIEHGERIRAVQKLDELRPLIARQEDEYRTARESQKDEMAREIAEGRTEYEREDVDVDDNRRAFWASKSKHAPEYRREAARKMYEFELLDERKRNASYDNDPLTRSERWDDDAPRKLFADDDDGRPLNVNQARLEFDYKETDEDIVVAVYLYKHMDPSQYEIDVEPNFVRITVKGKVFQLRLEAEVRCGAARAERSSATGKLIVTMPRVRRLRSFLKKCEEEEGKGDSKETKQRPPKIERLEVRQSDWNDGLDFSRICRKRGEAEGAGEGCGSPPPLEDIDAAEQ